MINVILLSSWYVTSEKHSTCFSKNKNKMVQNILYKNWDMKSYPFVPSTDHGSLQWTKKQN